MCLSRDEKVLAVAGSVSAGGPLEAESRTGKVVLLTLEWSDHLTHRLLYSTARVICGSDALFDQLLALPRPSCFLACSTSRQQLLFIDGAGARLIDAVASCRLMVDSYHILALDDDESAANSNTKPFCLYRINFFNQLL